MTLDAKTEGTPVGQIVSHEKREPDGVAYQAERIGRLLRENKPEKAAEILAQEIVDLESQRDEDPLTKLKTRESGVRELGRQAAISRETGRPLSVVMFDLDGFKRINDTQGHEKGNEAIKIMADFLNNRTSAIDIACRYARGDEFFLIMPGSTSVEATGLGNRIKEELPALMMEKGFEVTTSVGIAQLLKGDDAQSVLEKADEALLLAKEKGKNRVEVFEPKA